jgi:hypothetical protein
VELDLTLARMLSLANDAALRAPAEALARAQRAIDARGELVDARDAETLAIALAAAGRVDEATRVARFAEQKAREAGNERGARRIEQRARRFTTP